MTNRDASPVPVMALLTVVFASAAMVACKPANPPTPATPPAQPKTSGAPANRTAAGAPATNQNYQAGRDPFAPVAGQTNTTATAIATATSQSQPPTNRPAGTNWVQGRDLFDNPADYEKELPRLELQEISTAGPRPHAVINGRQVAVGDLVDGVRVEEIKPGSVTIQYKTIRKQLTMNLDWPALQLTEIVDAPPAKPAAVINGRRVEAGGMAGAAKVEAINPAAGAVTLSYRGQEKTLTWQAKAPELTLQGIAFQSAKPSALINGQTLFVGDRLEGAQVKTIGERQVVLEFKGQPMTLELKSKAGAGNK